MSPSNNIFPFSSLQLNRLEKISLPHQIELLSSQKHQIPGLHQIHRINTLHHMVGVHFVHSLDLEFCVEIDPLEVALLSGCGVAKGFWSLALWVFEAALDFFDEGGFEGKTGGLLGFGVFLC